MANDNRKARKALHRIKRMKGPYRIERRAAYMRSLPHEVRWRVARLAAGGTLPKEDQR